MPSRKRILQLKAATEANITDVGAKVVARGTNLLEPGSNITTHLTNWYCTH